MSTSTSNRPHGPDRKMRGCVGAVNPFEARGISAIAESDPTGVLTAMVTWAPAAEWDRYWTRYWFESAWPSCSYSAERFSAAARLNDPFVDAEICWRAG